MAVERILEIGGVDHEDIRFRHRFFRDAHNYISSFSWCSAVVAVDLAAIVPGVLGVYLVEILPAQAGIDTKLWVLVGDIPPAYLVMDDAKTTSDAVRAYIREMDLWVNAAREGKPMDGLIPVNVAPSRETAAMLASRLRLLESDIVPEL